MEWAEKIKGARRSINKHKGQIVKDFGDKPKISVNDTSELQSSPSSRGGFQNNANTGSIGQLGGRLGSNNLLTPATIAENGEDEDGDQMGVSPNLSSQKPEMKHQLSNREMTVNAILHGDEEEDTLEKQYGGVTQLGHTACKYEGVFHPDSRIRAFLDCVLVVVFSYQCLVTPFQMALYHDSESWVSFWVSQSMDCLFIVNNLLDFFTAYRPSREQMRTATEMELWLYLVTEKRKIVIHHISNFRAGFLPQLVWTFPYELLWILLNPKTLGEDRLYGAGFLRWLRGFRLLCRGITTKKIVHSERLNALRRIQAVTSMSFSPYVLTFIGSLLLLFHWMNCLFYAVASCDIEDESCHFADNEFIMNAPKDVARKYLVAAFRVLTLFNGESYELKSYTSVGELSVAIFTVLSGAIIFGVVFGELASMINKSKREHEEHTEKVKLFQKDMARLQLLPALQRQILDYMQMRFDMYKSEVRVREVFLKELNPALRGQIELYLKSEVIAEFPLVGDLLVHSRVVAMKLCSELELNLYLGGDVIGTRHAPCRRLMLLLLGKLKRNRPKGEKDNLTEEMILELSSENGVGKRESGNGRRKSRAVSTNWTTAVNLFKSSDDRGDILEGPACLFPKAMLIPDPVFAHSFVAKEHVEIHELSRTTLEELLLEFPEHSDHGDAVRSFRSQLELIAGQDELHSRRDVISAESCGQLRALQQKAFGADHRLRRGTMETADAQLEFHLAALSKKHDGPRRKLVEFNMSSINEGEEDNKTASRKSTTGKTVGFKVKDAPLSQEPGGTRRVSFKGAGVFLKKGGRRATEVQESPKQRHSTAFSPISGESSRSAASRQSAVVGTRRTSGVGARRTSGVGARRPSAADWEHIAGEFRRRSTATKEELMTEEAMRIGSEKFTKARSAEPGQNADPAHNKRSFSLLNPQGHRASKLFVAGFGEKTGEEVGLSNYLATNLKKKRELQLVGRGSILPEAFEFKKVGDLDQDEEEGDEGEDAGAISMPAVPRSCIQEGEESFRSKAVSMPIKGSSNRSVTAAASEAHGEQPAADPTLTSESTGENVEAGIDFEPVQAFSEQRRASTESKARSSTGTNRDTTMSMATTTMDRSSTTSVDLLEDPFSTKAPQMVPGHKLPKLESTASSRGSFESGDTAEIATASTGSSSWKCRRSTGRYAPDDLQPDSTGDIDTKNDDAIDIADDSDTDNAKTKRSGSKDSSAYSGSKLAQRVSQLEQLLENQICHQKANQRIQENLLLQILEEQRRLSDRLEVIAGSRDSQGETVRLLRGIMDQLHAKPSMTVSAFADPNNPESGNEGPGSTDTNLV